MHCNFINLCLATILFLVVGTLLDSGILLGLALLAAFFALSVLVSTWSFFDEYMTPAERKARDDLCWRRQLDSMGRPPRFLALRAA